jgi:hypothetical protein
VQQPHSGDNATQRQTCLRDRTRISLNDSRVLLCAVSGTSRVAWTVSASGTAARSSAVGARQTCLKITDDRAKNARCEKAWPEWPGVILPNRRQLASCSSDLLGHACELPANLFAVCLWTLRGGEPDGFGGVRRGTEGMGAHVRYR